MGLVLLIVGIVVPLLMAGTFVLGRHWQRRQDRADELSPVTRQHISLFQGEPLNEAEVELAKARLRGLLERGEVEAVEAGLRPGTHYVVQVRALAEIGTDQAGGILERQLHKRLTSDQVEQSWYWIDLANGLRSLNREQSLPHLLRCAEEAGELPLGHFFAAETVCFLGFSSYVRQAGTNRGRTALRLLHQALEGLRFGVQPHVVVEGRLGEVIERLWDERGDEVDPLVVRVFVEALRQLRRAPHTAALLEQETSEREAFEWQMSHVAALEPVLSDYVDEAPSYLCAGLARSEGPRQRDYLQALSDLRADAGPVVMALLTDRQFEYADEALELLTWSRDERVGGWLRDRAARHVPMARRARRRRHALPPLRPSSAEEVSYAAVLRALRGHPSPETEAFLLLAARDWDPTYRAAAVGSLGWWEPLDRPGVVACLQQARRDASPEVRRAARAAQARLGERQALHWYRQLFACEDLQRVHEAIHTIAAEGLTLLWPDLDALADSEDPEIAFHAREAVESLHEDRERGRPGL